jgi:hypothetical protein
MAMNLRPAPDKGYVNAEREEAFRGPGKVWGFLRKAPKGGPMHPLDGRRNRLIAVIRRAPVPDHQAPVRPWEDPLPRPRQKPRPTLHAGRFRQPVPGATEADGVRTSLPENRETSDVAARNARKQSPEAGLPVPKAIRRLSRRRRNR